MDPKSPQIFLSYAHESPEFRQSVKALADYLRTRGIRVITDHPYENRAPQEGWRTWMQHCVEDSDLVLVICTPKYKASFEKRDADLPAGFGRTWEAAIITQELYESKLQNAKYIPILPDGGAHQDVPVVLRDFSNGLCFPSQNLRISNAIIEDIQDPNANLPAFRRRPPGQLSADDNRLVADQRDVYGREAEIAQVLDFLNSTETATQVVAQLTGTGGIGKTEICKRSLQTWLRQSPGARAYWVGLNDGASPAECAATIARALGHENLAEPAQLLPLLRPGLYYLDNLESLDNPEGNALLRSLSQQPGLRLLASSRVRLAALGKPIEVDTLPLGAALHTFREAWTGGDELFDSPDFPVFVEHDLGCHALSLVLVAALGEAKSLRQITADWRTKGTAIAKQEQDPTRRGSLAVSLHLSSEAVAQHPGALLLWAIAALFPDGLDQGVLDWLYQSVPDINDESLGILIRHRILKRTGELYFLLPPVARFALDEARHEAGGFSWIGTKDAILPLFERMIQAADFIASTDAVLDARAVLLEKFSAVHRFVLEECHQDQPGADLLSSLQDGLRNSFQFSHVLGKEMLETIQPVLAQSTGNQRSNASALQALGDLEGRLGNVERARALYDEAIGLYKKEQSDLGRANALKALGDLEWGLGNVEQARALFHEAIGLYRKEQSDLGPANALKALGDLETALGNVEQARTLFDEAMGLYKKEQADLGRANVLKSLGQLETVRGNVEQARALYDESISLYKKEQSDWGRAITLKALGDLETTLQNPSGAAAYYQQALHLYTKEQAIAGLINTSMQMARLTHAFGPQGSEQATAQTWYERALHYAQQTNVQQYIDFVEAAGQQLFKSTEED